MAIRGDVADDPRLAAEAYPAVEAEREHARFANAQLVGALEAGDTRTHEQARRWLPPHTGIGIRASGPKAELRMRRGEHRPLVGRPPRSIGTHAPPGALERKKGEPAVGLIVPAPSPAGLKGETRRSIAPRQRPVRFGIPNRRECAPDRPELEEGNVTP